MIESKDETTADLDISNIPVYCHVFLVDKNNVGSDYSLCGVPRSEQPRHGPVRPLTINKTETFCPYCGYKRCQKCKDKI